MPGTAPDTLEKSAGLSRDLASPKIDPAAAAVCVGFAPPRAFPRDPMKSALRPGMFGRPGSCESPADGSDRRATRATHNSAMRFILYSFPTGPASATADGPETIAPVKPLAGRAGIE